jgi:hypothetical protein
MKTKILQIIFISILITTGGFACLFSPAVQGEMNPAKENSLTSLIAGLIGLTRSSNTTSSGNANTNTTGISTGTSTGNGTTATTGTSTGNGSTTTTGTGTTTVSAPSSLVYTGSPFTFTNGATIATQTPTITGTITNCAVTPSLPTGLTLNSTTCAISGTPTVNQAATSYTITASNSSGNTTGNVSITVNMAAPSNLVYSGSPFTFTNGSAIVTQTPTVTGTVTGCVASPSMPTGLILNATTCAISGTPTVNQGANSYTITASNAFGNTTKSISITINMAAPSNLVYSGSPFTFTNGSAIVTQTPTVTGTVTGCVASPSLPTGLILNATTCAISGTPTVTQGANSYTITASNTFGNTTKSISITINTGVSSLTVIASLSKDAPGTVNDRYTSYAYTNNGYTVTKTQYTGNTTSSGTLYAIITDTYDTSTSLLLSRATDYSSGSTSDTLVTFSYSSGRLSQMTTRTGGTTLVAPITSIMNYEFNISSFITCLQITDGLGVTNVISKYSYNVSNQQTVWMSYNAGTCASPSALSFTVNYSYDGSGNKICAAWSSGIIEKYPSYDGNGNALSNFMYSSGSCISPVSLISSYSYSYLYSGSNQICNSSTSGATTTVDSFILSSSIPTSYLRYSSGNCSIPSTLSFTTNLTTTTINSNNNSLSVNFSFAKLALTSDTAP